LFADKDRNLLESSATNRINDPQSALSCVAYSKC